MIAKDLLKTSPLRYEEKIPVFSENDFYTDNYKKISNDHLKAMQSGTSNPFIAEKLWETLEESTRSLILQHHTPDMKVLDVGVGTGRLLKDISNVEKYGIDISMSYLELAQESGYNVAYSRIEDMPFLDNTFDMVVTTDVLEHVIDLNYCCQQILRVLRPGGTLIIRVPNLEDLSGYLDKNIPYEYVHLRNFDLYGLRLLFEKIFHCTYLDHLYVAPVLSAVSRLKVRLLSQSNPIMSVLKSLEQDNHPLSFLKSISSISEEEFLDLACNLRENHPEIFNEFSEHIIHALEVNVVFKKN